MKAKYGIIGKTGLVGFAPESGLHHVLETYIRTPRAGKAGLVGTLRRLIELYSAHIWKEDYLLFPMANKLLNDSEQRELLTQFEQHDSEIGIDVHHGFEQLAGRILEMICAGTGACRTA